MTIKTENTELPLMICGLCHAEFNGDLAYYEIKAHMEAEHMIELQAPQDSGEPRVIPCPDGNPQCLVMHYAPQAQSGEPHKHDALNCLYPGKCPDPEGNIEYIKKLLKEAQDRDSESTVERTKDSSERKPRGDGVEAILTELLKYGYNELESSIATAEAAIELLLLEARMDELNKLEFHGHGSDKQTLAALYTHKLLSLRALQSNQKGKA